jgi:hypothetical protein
MNGIAQEFGISLLFLIIIIDYELKLLCVYNVTFSVGDAIRFVLISIALKSIDGIPFVNKIPLIVTVWSQYTELSQRSLVTV